MSVVECGLSVPQRTDEQRFAALAEANRIRSHRAVLKRQIKAGRVSARDVFADWDCNTMKVLDLLLALPKVGRVKAHKILRRAEVSPSKTLAGLSDRQFRLLLALLP